MLANNRIDLILTNQATINEEAKRAGLSSDLFEIYFDAFETVDYFAFSLQTPDELVKRVQDSYDELLMKGEIKLLGNE